MLMPPLTVLNVRSSSITTWFQRSIDGGLLCTWFDAPPNSAALVVPITTRQTWLAPPMFENEKPPAAAPSDPCSSTI
jgi:hypothetical protein